MGLFSKLFGSGKSDFIPSADPMTEDKFWQLIAASRSNAGGEPEWQQTALATLLQKLPLNDLIIFKNRYRELRSRGYTWPIWGAVYIINGGCGYTLTGPEWQEEGDDLVRMFPKLWKKYYGDNAVSALFYENTNPTVL